jgi:hypothetical protein
VSLAYDLIGFHLLEFGPANNPVPADHLLNFIPEVGKWETIEMDLDISQGGNPPATVTVLVNSLGGGAPRTLVDHLHVTDSQAFGAPSVSLGMQFVQGPAPTQVAHFDNVVLDVKGPP